MVSHDFFRRIVCTDYPDIDDEGTTTIRDGQNNSIQIFPMRCRPNISICGKRKVLVMNACGHFCRNQSDRCCACDRARTISFCKTCSIRMKEGL